MFEQSNGPKTQSIFEQSIGPKTQLMFEQSIGPKIQLIFEHSPETNETHSIHTLDHQIAFAHRFE